MTDPTQAQAPPWYERAARQRRLRVLGWLAALLIHPFLYVFPVYRAIEATYRNAREPCGGYDSYAGCWRRAFVDLREESIYHCQVDSENPVPSTHARSIVETLGRGHRVAVPLSAVHLGMSRWLFEKDWPLFRQGFAMREVCRREAAEGSAIAEKVRRHCKAQGLHFLRGEPVEPIAIYGEVRALFEDTARRFDLALAEYERIRLLFGVLMWSWAALQLAGVVLFLGIVRADIARWRVYAAQRGRRG